MQETAQQTSRSAPSLFLASRDLLATSRRRPAVPTARVWELGVAELGDLGGGAASCWPAAVAGRPAAPARPREAGAREAGGGRRSAPRRPPACRPRGHAGAGRRRIYSAPSTGSSPLLHHGSTGTRQGNFGSSCTAALQP